MDLDLGRPAAVSPARGRSWTAVGGKARSGFPGGEKSVSSYGSTSRSQSRSVAETSAYHGVGSETESDTESVESEFAGESDDSFDEDEMKSSGSRALDFDYGAVDAAGGSDVDEYDVYYQGKKRPKIVWRKKTASKSAVAATTVLMERAQGDQSEAAKGEDGNGKEADSSSSSSSSSSSTAPALASHVCSSYEGFVVESSDVRSGYGTHRDGRGNSFAGTWASNEAQGFGRKTFSTGDEHAGMYARDKREGWGSCEFFSLLKGNAE